MVPIWLKSDVSGAQAEGSACIYNTSTGAVIAANMFKAGALDAKAKATCPPPS